MQIWFDLFFSTLHIHIISYWSFRNDWSTLLRLNHKIWTHRSLLYQTTLRNMISCISQPTKYEFTSILCLNLYTSTLHDISIKPKIVVYIVMIVSAICTLINTVVVIGDMQNCSGCCICPISTSCCNEGNLTVCSSRPNSNSSSIITNAQPNCSIAFYRCRSQNGVQGR